VATEAATPSIVEQVLALCGAKSAVFSTIHDGQLAQNVLYLAQQYWSANELYAHPQYFKQTN
jgi:hypothetical protein